MISSIRFELELALRFLTENRGQTTLILLGITIGVAVMVFLSALIDGLQADLIDKTVGSSPHIIVTRQAQEPLQLPEGSSHTGLFPLQLQRSGNRPIVEWQALTTAMRHDSQLSAVLPVLDGAAIIRRGSVSKSVALRGMALAEADPIYHISDSIIAGSPKMEPGSLLIGSELASELDLRPGDTVMLEIIGQDPISQLVGGIFDLGVQNLNKRWVIIDRTRAASLLGMQDRVTEIEMQVNDIFSASDLAQRWAERLPGYEVVSWQESNASLLSALKSQSNSSYTIQFFVLLAVTLGVSSVLAISAVQKSKQIGILKAIGIRTASVERVFMLQGGILGTVGSIGGTILGTAMAQIFIFMASSDQQFALLLKPATVAIIVALTLLSAILAAYLPARQVARTNPVEVIRNG